MSNGRKAIISENSLKGLEILNVGFVKLQIRVQKMRCKVGALDLWVVKLIKDVKTTPLQPPSATRASTRWEPIKPAPPVTRIARLDLEVRILVIIVMLASGER